MKKKKPTSQQRDQDDLDFPWEADDFLEEDTSEYPELGNADPVARGTVEQTADLVFAEHTSPLFEDTDRSQDDTSDLHGKEEDTSEVLDEEEGEEALESRRRVPIKAPAPEERFFPDIPELTRNEEDSAVSGLLKTADDISRVIALNRPRPGPFLHWYFSLAPSNRRKVYKGLWMLSASLLIITLFTIATVGIFPLLEDRFTATFGPRPEQAERFLPDQGQLFALVEDRPYRHDRFIAGMDCIWVASDPVSQKQIAGFGPYLEQDGEMIAVLDVEETWNGMARLYFDRGEVPLNEPVDLVIPVKGGGSSLLYEGPGFRLSTEGGDIPSRVVLGPVIFKEEP